MPVQIRAHRHRIMLLVGIVAIVFLFKGGYMQAKAHFAQFLIEQAWSDTLNDGKQHKPWSWADTYPVAKLQFVSGQGQLQGQALYVLAGASGRNLAFGPATLMGANQLNGWGNTVIAGHRDTHFAHLKGVQPGQLLRVQDSSSATIDYRVVSIQIVAEADTRLLDGQEDLQLTLVTCYPFDSLSAQSRWRFVVIAEPVAAKPQIQLASVAA